MGAFTWGCPGASGALARRQCCSFDVPLKRHCQRPAGTIRAEGGWGGLGGECSTAVGTGAPLSLMGMGMGCGRP